MCFAATNRAVRIIFVASAFDVVEAYTADGERAVTGTGPHIIFIPNSITLVRGREGTNTEVGMDFMTNVGPLEYCSLRKTPLTAYVADYPALSVDRAGGGSPLYAEDTPNQEFLI